MSLRYEVGAATDIPLSVINPPTDPAEHGLDLPPGTHTLVIGDPAATAYAVTGSPDELRAFTTRIANEVRIPSVQDALRLARYDELAARARRLCDGFEEATRDMEGEHGTKPSRVVDYDRVLGHYEADAWPLVQELADAAP